MRRFAILAAAACLAAPAAATATHGHHDGPRAAARTACKAERESLGRDAFHAKYANDRGRRAMRRCVRQRLRAARAACRDERATDRAAFRAKYANDRGRRAFRGCLRAHAG
jgi:hypothetical protein